MIPVSIPFVSKNQIKYVNDCLERNWISTDLNFYPEKPITKDQLIALFSKTNAATTKLKTVFTND